jgi:glucose-6-phosphate 1-dehydrogenase
MRVAPVDMAFEYGAHFGENALPEAYERLLLDALQGDTSLLARSDEITLAWALTDRLAGPVDPAPYPARRQGPQAADALLAGLRGSPAR